LRSKEAKALKAAQDKEKPVAAKINNIYALPTFTTITAGKAEKPSPDSTPALSPSLLLEYAEDSADKKLRPPKVSMHCQEMKEIRYSLVAFLLSSFAV